MRRHLAALCVALCALPLTVPSGARATPTPASSARSVPEAGSPSRSDAIERALLALRVADLQGESWTHSRLRGKITLIDFWATWCAPCLRELPFLKRAHDLYAGEFQILGVSLDTLEAGELRRWLRTQQVPWPQVRAAGGFDDPLARRFRVDRLPTNYLIDQEGRVRATDVRGRDLFLEIEKLRARRNWPR